jgi:hypothetical protein
VAAYRFAGTASPWAASGRFNRTPARPSRCCCRSTCEHERADRPAPISALMMGEGLGEALTGVLCSGGKLDG